MNKPVATPSVQLPASLGLECGLPGCFVMTITILRRPVRTPFAAILLCGGLSVFTLTQDVTAQAPSSRAGRSLTLQVLLDRAGFSPGEIDGGVGQNTRKAIEAFQAAHELQPTGEADDATWKALGGAAADDVLVLGNRTALLTR